jgi:uncharacterized membrane protein YeaQ/YmgE (transglycosylase-associated protein family)
MMEPLDPDLSSLFAQEQKRAGPPDHVQERVQQAVLATIAVGAVGALGAAHVAHAAGVGVASSLSSGAASAASASTVGAASVVSVASAAAPVAKVGAWAAVAALAKPAVVVVAAATAAVTGGIAVSRMGEPPAPSAVSTSTAPAVSPAPMVSIPAPAAVVTPVAPMPAPVVSVAVAAPVLSREPAVPSAAPAQASPETLAAERALLARAQNQLARGDAGGALITLEALASTTKDARMVEEREALAILALADAGREDEARRKAARFNSAYPRSLFAQRIAARLQRVTDPLDR